MPTNIGDVNGIGGMADAAKCQFLGNSNDISTEQRDVINGLNAEPFILEEERIDIEGFISRFPGLVKSYIPVSIIGEGTSRWPMFRDIQYCLQSHRCPAL